MKQLSPGVYTGTADSGLCFKQFLTLDKNSNRVYVNYTKSAGAQNANASSICANVPRTQVLMNCTSWARSRNAGATAPRYCDFGKAGDKK